MILPGEEFCAYTLELSSRSLLLEFSLLAMSARDQIRGLLFVFGVVL